MQEFEKRGLKPAAIIEAGNTEFIKQLVRKDKGYSFLASLCVRDELRRGELATIPLEDGIFMDIYVVELKGRTLSPAVASILNFLQENKKSVNVTK